MAPPTSEAAPLPSHPRLKPALRRAWRSRDTVQLGITRSHAVVVGPLDTATTSFIGLLDGTRGLPLLRQEARAMGLPEGRADAVVARLVAAGVIDDPWASAGPAALVRDDPGAMDRLRADLAALSVRHPEPDAGLRLLGARRAARVQVRGAGRVGAAVAALLSAAGVGQVDVQDGGCVEPWDVLPAGTVPDQVGERRDAAARRLVRSAAVARRSPRASAEPRGLSLVVLAPRDGLAVYAPEPDTAEPLITTGTPHLYAGVLEGTGVVGPLVVPGATCCAACMAIRRAEREPGWPRLLAQWQSGRRAPAPACDAALATTVAGLAAAQALAFLDGGAPPSVGARLEITLPGLAWDLRPIAPHPDCACATMTASVAEYSSNSEGSQATMSG
ncbi:TOMM precursor leader peptide-binding protein [Streptomyces buecherae]|uniref:TOMM leader peptide-binding protein n=1 Tax=Streptomyces buecherae TaxID=2763006 RepID=A0A7H8NCT1_9ACTN|nr:TOMM precursor leader peptide-binding protein [Streptomyces buecherae]QKW52263.1 TOMM precursor leader peptide-binding protein [Streptomyces buecherae]